MSAVAADGPAFSVLIARASTQDRTRIFETLESLRQQDCDFAYEVVVIDRLDDEISAAIEVRFPEVRLVRCGPEPTLPQMRTAALQLARGRLVAVTEDHCTPARDWLRALDAAFGRHPGAVAVGGCVLNGITATAFDWATYLCEYASFASPVGEGPSADLPGMNIAYLRQSLLSQPPDSLTRGFWETTVHPGLRALGLFVASDAAAVTHCKHFSLRWFLIQRFAYSRYFAGNRFAQRSPAVRFAAALLTPVLPVVLLVRLAAVVRRKPGLAAHATRALPFLVLFHIVWSAGECVGYARGPGSALRQIE